MRCASLVEHFLAESHQLSFILCTDTSECVCTLVESAARKQGGVFLTPGQTDATSMCVQNEPSEFHLGTCPPHGDGNVQAGDLTHTTASRSGDTYT
jgi:hypothetical protein